MKYIMVYDTLNFTDSIECNSFEEAKDTMIEVYKGWMRELSDASTDDWNAMIENCDCWIETCDGEESLSFEELDAIGWTRR